MFYIALFVFVFCFKNAFAIQCYECSSQNNSMCLDPASYDEETLRNFLPLTNCGEGIHSNNQHEFFCRLYRLFFINTTSLKSV
ncbi:uncharacterized protein LOC142979417 [Anticarsia gemmatalis]|uniref:uncharacterized protein LOC142979417 n=1 Tax=Anticarsia gemmatalis TaxID=129554 RepID=UPI003F76184E